jgi:hypothetical protein
MSAETETWIKLLATYGPFALLVLFVFVVERRVANDLKEQRDQPNNLPIRFVYGATWGSIFVLCGVIVWVWIKINVPSGEAIIRGTLSGLTVKQQVLSKNENVFLRRVYSTAKDFDFVFRILSAKKLSTDKAVDLVISDESTDMASIFRLPIDASFYSMDKEVVLIYNRKDDTLALDKPNSEIVPLKKLASMEPLRSIFAEQPGVLARLFPPTTVYAQGQKKGGGQQQGGQDKKEPVANVIQRLDSYDAILRMDARQELIRGGKTSAPDVEAVLNDPGSSARQQAGVIAALNSSKALAEEVSDAALCNVVEAARSTEPAVKSEANKFLAANPDIAKSKECRPIPGRDFACTGSRLVRLKTGGGIQHLTVGSQQAYVWQPGLDTSNISTVYVIHTDQSGFPVSGKLDKDDFAKLESKLKKTESAQLPPNTYSIHKVKNNDTIDVKLAGGGEIKAFVHETKYTDSRTDFKICVP